jgi:hypothetical protein
MRVAAVNSIVAGNSSSAGDPDCRIAVVSNGYNLMPCPLTAPDPTTFMAEPRLAPLKSVRILSPSDSGTILVHGLLPGSPALDRGGCYPSLDERGLDRPHGVACDRGAVEMLPLCTGGVGMAETRMVVRRSPDGTATMKVRGQLLFADPALPIVDPVADGFQLRIEDVSGASGALLERTFVTDPWSAPGVRRVRTASNGEIRSPAA